MGILTTKIVTEGVIDWISSLGNSLQVEEKQLTRLRIN